MKRTIIAAALALAAPSAMAVAVEWTVASGGNGHWYELVDQDLTWGGADNFIDVNRAGLGGYLATVTTQGEFDFIRNALTDQVIWLGGSDEAAEGTWQWVRGPEAGQAFWINGVTQAGFIAPWNAGEPNNCCNGENFLQMNWDVNGEWNDHGGPGNEAQRNWFVIEYASNPDGTPVPAPGVLALLGMGLVGLGLRRK